LPDDFWKQPFITPPGPGMEAKTGIASSPIRAAQSTPSKSRERNGNLSFISLLYLQVNEFHNRSAEDGWVAR